MFKRLIRYWRFLCRIEKDIIGYPPYQLENMDYDDYWNRRPLASVTPRIPIIDGLISYGSSVLDVGCGDGALLAYLKESKSIQELGIDISRIAVEKAQKRGLQASVKLLSDLVTEANHQFFDHVVMTEVIEHVANSEDFIRWGWSLAQKSLILSFPNIAYWRHRFRLLFGRFPVQWAYHPSEHLRFWSIPDFSYFINQVNLIDVLPPKFYPTNGTILLHLVQKFPNLFCNQVVVHLQRKQK